jgi:hypothetical protein
MYVAFHPKGASLITLDIVLNAAEFYRFLRCGEQRETASKELP